MKWLIGAIVALVLAGGVVFTVAYASSEREVTCTIVDKAQTVDVQVTSDDDGNTSSTTTQVYTIYTDECGPLRIEDVWWRWQYDSAERYGAVKVGGVYQFTTLGWRVQWLGWYPNIIELGVVELPTL